MSDQVNYRIVEGWEQLPNGFAHRDVAGVAVDQEDRVYLICRGENPVIVYDRQGNFLRTWGKGDFSMRTHGIYVAPMGPSSPPTTAIIPFGSLRRRAACS